MNDDQPKAAQAALEESLRTDFETLDEVEKEVEKGDLRRVSLMRKAFFDHRAKVMKAMTETGPKGPAELEMIKAVVDELRVRERDFNDRIRAAQDREHAVAMAKLAADSNEIAGRLANAAAQANVLTDGLKTWTKVMALATAALVMATVVLIVVTATAG